MPAQQVMAWVNAPTPCCASNGCTGVTGSTIEQAHSIFYILQQYSNLTLEAGGGGGPLRLVACE